MTQISPPPDATEPARTSEALPTQPGRDFPLLEGYRAIAATLVVATHVGFQTGVGVVGPWAGLLARLDFGVALFFVLSGFLLFRPYASRHLDATTAPRLPRYLNRRARRILPAYWVVVVAAIVLLEANRWPTAWGWAVQLLLLQTYTGDLLPGLTQMWSLGTEVAFYLALPLIGLLVCRLPGRTRQRRAAAQLVLWVVLAVIATTYRCVVINGGYDSRMLFWLPAYLDWFAVGMALATMHTLVSGPEPLPRWAYGVLAAARSPGSCWAAGAAVFWVSTSAIAGPYGLVDATLGASLVKHLLYAVAAGLLLLPATVVAQPGGVFAGLLGNRVMQRLGTVSYGVFLWNVLVIALIVKVTDQRPFTGPWWLDFIAAWSISVGVAALSWYLLERRVLGGRRAVIPLEVELAP